MKFHIKGTVTVKKIVMEDVDIDDEFMADTEEEAIDDALDFAEESCVDAEETEVEDSDLRVVTLTSEDDDRRANYRMMVASGAPTLPGFN